MSTKALNSQMDCHKATAASSIDSHTRAGNIVKIRKPVGKKRVGGASGGVLWEEIRVAESDLLVVYTRRCYSRPV